MSQRVKDQISKKWSKAPARVQLKLIKEYVEQYGKNNTDQWLNYLQELFGIRDACQCYKY